VVSDERRPRHPADGRPCRSELLAALSLAIDLSLGQPMDHQLRTALLATQLAERVGLDAAQREVVLQVGLVAWIGCHADSPELARWFGDDIGFRAECYRINPAGLPFLRLALRRSWRGRPGPGRARRVAWLLADPRGRFRALVRSQRLSAGLLAERLGLDPEVRTVLRFASERWDGGGLPAGVRGPAIPIEMRLVQLADLAEVHLHDAGPEAAIRVVRERSGSQLDPALVAAFESGAAELVRGLPAPEDLWAAALTRAPLDDDPVDEAEFDDLLAVLADIADLRRPGAVGHSRGVADLAGAAAMRLGLPETELRVLRQAALIHDLGRSGVSCAVWSKSGPLTEDEWATVRLYPHLSGRIVRPVTGLADAASVAAAHGERLDGSGYPNGLRAAVLTMPARLLAAADAYQAMCEPRPHRAALAEAEAAARLSAQVRAGRLDPEAVDAVLGAAAHRPGGRESWPAGLTGPEVDVLRLIAQGLSTPAVAAELGLRRSAVRRHLDQLRLKISVRNRTGAALFAAGHGLTGPPSGIPSTPPSGALS
jgi:HD-GYP domain-containing protein (c-di-GMP phosphodiesterase class II)